MTTRIRKFTATACATALLAGVGTVLATSASAATAPASTTVATHAVPATVPVPANSQLTTGDPSKCKGIYLLGLCLTLDLDLTGGGGGGGGS